MNELTGKEILKLERERAAIGGRHMTVAKNEDYIVVGLIGNLCFHDLTEYQHKLLRDFHGAGLDSRAEYLSEWPVKRNGPYFTGFIKYHLNERT